MFISDIAIKRPVFTIALSVIIMIIGLLSYRNLSLQQYPDVEEPTLTVETFYQGAAPSIIENKITTVLEDALSGLTGLDYMESTSSTGQSKITLFFKEGLTLSEASSEIRDKLAQVADDLPEDALEPKISKNRVSETPFMFIHLTSPHEDELALYDYADRNLKAPFESLPGVGSVLIYGSPTTMQVRLDREKLKAYNLAVTDVLDTIKDSSQELSAGNIIKGKRHVDIVTNMGIKTPEDMENLPLSTFGGHVVHLKDVATIGLGKDTGQFQWFPKFNKKPAIFLAVKKIAGGNMMAISNAVEKQLTLLKEGLPKTMNLDIGYDFSMFIDASIKAVTTTIFEAIILVLLIILFFLHSPRAALIPLLTIPVSLIGSFAFLYAFHCSINTITLLAMVLAIGLVVDDAIVVLENIHRHIEQGLKPFDAAIKGAREVGFAIIAMTLTLASVYAPIAFVQGLTGKLFAEFAVTLAGAVLISGVVALTLSPMMCARLLHPKEQEKKNRITKRIESFLSSLDHTYQRALHKALASPKALGGGLLAVLVVGGFVFYKLPSELAPQEDIGVVQAYAQGPEGATVDSMFAYTPKLEDLLTSVPEHESLISVTERAGIFGIITLKPWSQRKRSQQEILKSLWPQAKKIHGVDVSVFPYQSLMSGGQGGIQMAVKTTGSYEELEKEMDRLVKKLKESPDVQSASHDLLIGTPQLTVNIDRNKAALLDVKVKDIARTLEIMLSGARDMTFERGGKHYDIVVQSHEAHQKNLENIGNFYVKSETQQDLIPLRNLITLEEKAAPSSLKHVSKLRASTLNVELNPGSHMGKGLALVKAEAKEILPASFQMEPVGNLRKFMDSQGDMVLIFLASLLFIYLVLAIQFESLLDPLLIMITVPLSMTGALLTLYLTGGTLNVFSQVGLITLVGLITKHGILIVEFANKQRDEGLSVVEAVYKAAALRLRPILMTTGAMVLGAVPLALASGAGAESRQQIGWVLVGGLLGGTFFTLFAVPLVYTLVKGWKERRA